MSIDQQMSEDAQFFEEVTKGGHILLDSQNISQNKVEIGDIIVVSDGHKFFCAIGEVRGEKKRPNQNGSNHHFVKHLFSLRVPMIWGQSQGDSAAYRPLDHVLSAHLADPKRQTMRDELMGVGMRIVEVDGDEGLFVASTHEKIAAHFRGTRWAAGHAGMMRNMDGVPMSRRILGHVTHGFRVSLSDLKKFVEDGTDNEKELDISNSIRTHRPEFEIPHRLPVNWLWVDRAGVSAEEIYQETFPRDTIYLLKKDLLIIPALEQYMNSGNSEGVAKPKPFVLIIDEINRANISKVFGELITLLESDKRLNQPNELRVRLPYSGDKFGVPSNLHIIGTMNTADRSIALLDTALRRRFTFREMMPDAFILSEAARTCGIDLPRLLSTINERIEYLYDREHQIGHAYFIACKSRLDVDEKMRHEIIPLLAEYFFDDWGKIAAVLGDLESHEREINGGFLKRSVLEAPPGLEDDEAVPRFRWRVRTENEGFDYGNLVGA